MNDRTKVYVVFHIYGSHLGFNSIFWKKEAAEKYVKDTAKEMNIPLDSWVIAEHDVYE